jgi:hypothetical protein
MLISYSTYAVEAGYLSDLITSQYAEREINYGLSCSRCSTFLGDLKR